MAIDLQREEVLLPTDRRGIKLKSNVDRTNKPSTKTGHPQNDPAVSTLFCFLFSLSWFPLFAIEQVTALAGLRVVSAEEAAAKVPE